MSIRPIPWSFVLGLLAIVAFVALLFATFTFVLFRFYPLPSSAADFGQAISGISALFTALAFAGALYAVFLQRKALELQQQQMTKEIGEVQQQTKLLTEQLQQVAPIQHLIIKADATDQLLDVLFNAAQESINEAILHVETSETGGPLRRERARTLRQWLEVYLKASKLFLVSGEGMAQEIAVPKVRGTEMRVHAVWTKKREEIAHQLGEWATEIKKNFV